MTVERYISVTALTRYLKKKIESDRHLQEVWLRGEISNFKKHTRGHMYMTLKDKGSRIQSVMFAGNNQNIGFEPENGMKVLIRGEISVYEPYGQYQLYIKEMQPDGVGNLYLAFEKLKQKLELAGYFAEERKRPLPTIPREIGVITSPTGAAIKDIFTTVKRRFPAARLTVFPVLVQGEHAARSISGAIKSANDLGFLDVLIVGRGGGSIEELWAFNEEIVAQSIFYSTVPIISAVGHETDFTIADFVADLRAATPTAAGELVVPHIKELQERIDERVMRLTYAIKKKVEKENDSLTRLRSSYAFRYPAQLMRQKEQDLDRLVEQLTRSTKRHVKQLSERTEQTVRLLYKHHPSERIKQLSDQSDQMKERLTRAMSVHHQQKQHEWMRLIGQLNVLSPLSIMERGYSLAYSDTGQLVKSVKQIEPGEPLKLKMADGTVDCQVWGIEEREPNG